MKTNTPFAFVIAILGTTLLAMNLDLAQAQCGGCKGGCKNGGRSEAARTRLDPGWSTPRSPSTGESLARTDFFESIKEVREAAKRGHLSLLYLYDSTAGAKALGFEDALLRNEKLAIALKAFRCLKLDVAKNPDMVERYGAAAPRFVTFNTKGRRVQEISMAGYRKNASGLLKALVKTSKGHAKTPLLTFVKQYRAWLNDLDKLDARKKSLAAKRQRAGDSSPKLRKIGKEQSALDKEEQALLAREKKLLEAVKACPASRDSGKTAAAAPKR